MYKRQVWDFFAYLRPEQTILGLILEADDDERYHCLTLLVNVTLSFLQNLSDPKGVRAPENNGKQRER